MVGAWTRARVWSCHVGPGTGGGLLLLEVPYPERRLYPAHLAGGGLVAAGEDAEERGLPGAVGPDEADPLSGGQGETEVVPDNPVVILLLKVRYLQ